MPKCSRCGKRGFFLSLNDQGICQECAANDSRKRKADTSNTTFDSDTGSSSFSHDAYTRESLVLNWLAKEDRFVRRDLIENKNCPVYVLRHYEEKSWLDGITEHALRKNSNTSSSWLGDYYKRSTISRWAVAFNPSAPQWVLDDIFEKGQLALRSDSDSDAVEVLEWLAANPNIRPEWRRFFLSPECNLFGVKPLIAINPTTSENELLQLIDVEFNRDGGNLQAVRNCLANPNLSRRALVSNGLFEDERSFIRVHIGANPNLIESDFLNILECLHVLNGKTADEKIKMLTGNAGHILQDGLRATIDEIICNPAATETVHRKIIGVCREALNTSSDPYHYSMSFCTEKAPSAIIETLVRDYGIKEAVQRIGTPKKLLEEFFHTEGKFGPQRRSYAVRNPDFPRLFLREPEEDAYIVETAKKASTKVAR